MEFDKIAKKANQIRIEVIKMVAKAGSGHPAGSLGTADIFAALYFSVLNHKPKKPLWPNRDRVILSAGHLAPVWYASLALTGYFPIRELMTLRQINSRLQGHPLRQSVPGIENTSGSLGQGISVACGVALAGKQKKASWRVFCLSSDGEQQEGQTWEAVMFAAARKLDNLILMIDRNQIQISGQTEAIMPIESLMKKYQAFGWQTVEIDGHNFQQIIECCQTAQPIGKPKAIIARTTPGKGVSFMENDFNWHGKAPTQEEAKKALKELNWTNWTN